jgi:trans-aconitate 2-methyltransferase
MYCWNPELYASSSSAQKSWGIELLAKIPLKGTERVLDIGCGDGKLSAEIAMKVPLGSVLGIGLSEAMISFAKVRYPEEKFPNLAFMQMDAESLSFGYEFDLIYSNAALHFIKRPENVENALKGFKKSLKPGGVLLAQFGGKGNAEEVIRVINLMLEGEKWSPYFRDFVFPYGFYGPD